MRKYMILIAGVLFLCLACKDYLAEKPASDITEISTEEDIKKLLSYTLILNKTEPGVIELATDDYFLSDQSWAALSNENDRSLYLWKNVPMDLAQWTGMYNVIFYVNTILDHIDHVQFKNISNYNRYKGMALFHRARCYYRILQTYSQAYDANEVENQLGFVLRGSSDINIKSKRLSMKESYEYLIRDLKSATVLLAVEEKEAAYPNKSAAFSLLTNLYFDQHEYEQAFVMADSSLFYNRQNLLDFRTGVQHTSSIPFMRNNKEVIFYATLNGSQALAPTRAKVALELIDLYPQGDLRVKLFYQKSSDGSYSFKGNYDGNITSSYLFSGITVAELLLQRAEAASRTKRTEIALADLNKLRLHRIDAIFYTALLIQDNSDLIDEIIKERRRELVFRGRRWNDLRRLAVEGRLHTDLKRVLQGETYRLSPSDIVKLAFKLPNSVITNSSIEQNN